MKFIKEETLINNDIFSKSKEYKLIQKEIRAAIKSIVWPANSDKFKINPEHHGNGVVPIKTSFITYLQNSGWNTELKIDVEATTKTPGKIDAVKRIGNSFFAVEWETGNISSSHRALNKMVVGILAGKLLGGTLILPTRDFYNYLTDRVGNFSELEPYFPVWRNLGHQSGQLTVIAVEHDSTDETVPKIQKGTDGRAQR